MKIDTSECIPIEYIKDQIEEYRKFDHLRMYAEFLDMFIQDYKDNAMANYTDRKTENSSEIPNNYKVKNYCDDCLYTDTCDSKEFFYACTSKATISKMEQVDKDINVRSKDEPQTCSVNGRPYTDCCNCEYFKCTADVPQTERSE